MKLKPTQWIGVAAIIVFGGGMIFRLTQPSEREVMARRIASLPTMSVPAPTFSVPELTPVVIPTAPALSTGTAAPADLSAPGDTKYLEVGSQAAKDDLYCAGVVSAEFDAKVKTEHPDKVAPLMDMQKRLNSAGIAKLKTERVTDGSDWAGFTLAYAAQAKVDYAAGKVRLPVAACVERAGKLPPGDLY